MTHVYQKQVDILIRLYVTVLSATVCTVGYVYLLRRVHIFVDFVSFLSMIIYEVLDSLLCCLRYNNGSTWFLNTLKLASLKLLNVYILYALIRIRY